MSISQDMYGWPDEPFEEMDSTLAVQQVHQYSLPDKIFIPFNTSWLFIIVIIIIIIIIIALKLSYYSLLFIDD